MIRIHSIRPESLDSISAIAFLDRANGRTPDVGHAPWDEKTRHIIALECGALVVGSAAITEIDSLSFIPMIAVDEQYRGQGVGKRIVLSAEEMATNAGSKNIAVAARVVDWGFYTKLGYIIEAPAYAENGLSLVRMRKQLMTARLH